MFAVCIVFRQKKRHKSKKNSTYASGTVGQLSESIQNAAPAKRIAIRIKTGIAVTRDMISQWCSRENTEFYHAKDNINVEIISQTSEARTFRLICGAWKSSKALSHPEL